MIASKKISIGKNCMIAPNVHIVDSNHGTEQNKAYNEQDNIVAEVHIGDNVWIGRSYSLDGCFYWLKFNCWCWKYCYKIFP